MAVSLDNKVVRVDEVLDSKGSDKADSIFDSADTDEIGSIIENPTDTVLALPDGWPKIAKLQEKQSWDYSTTINPSVNKATSHLELLQTIIEEWNRETPLRNIPSLRSNIKAHADEVPGSRQQLSFHSEHGPDTSVCGLSSASQLTVHGVGVIAEPPSKTTKVVEVAENELPYLGADEVIDEVITLLAKMETDRTQTVASLTSERDRVTMLRTKIDSLAMQRLIDLPVAVQKEHEDCAMDISELNWHVSYRGRILERNNNKVTVADSLNVRLKEDICFVKKHIPLVMEKLDLEVDAMERIKQAQIDTNEELDSTITRCNKMEAKSAEAHAKAEQERLTIQKDLDTVKEDLHKISEELSEAKMTFNTYTHQCNDYRQQLQDNDQELVVLLVKDENVKAAEALQAAKVQELETQIKQKEFEHRTLEDENIRLQSRLDHNKAKYAKKEQDLRTSIQHKQENLRSLTRDNDELAMDIEDLDKKLRDCDRQKVADEKNLERMRKELDRTEEQINFTKDDLGNVSIINNAVRDQLQKEEERCVQAEEALRSTTEGLKKQVKEEIHSRTVLMARIQSDGSDLTNTHDEVKTKKDMISKKFNEVNKAVKIILGKVEKLQSFHREKTKLISDINEELKQIADTRDKIGETCGKQKDGLVPKHKKHKEEKITVEKKLDHIEWKTDMMDKKIKEMDESEAMMVKSLNKTNTAIAQLEADLNEFNIQIDTGQHMQDELKANLNQVTSRTEDTENVHREHMQNRKKVLKAHENALEYNLSLNKELAGKYRHLQNQYVLVKNNMLNKYDDQIQLESAVKDLKQLKGLQLRMHTALLEYLKLRGLYNQGELQRMEDVSHGNGTKVTDLQGQMDSALDKIAQFLKQQLDGDTIRKMAMDKVNQEEAV